MSTRFALRNHKKRCNKLLFAVSIISRLNGHLQAAAKENVISSAPALKTRATQPQYLWFALPRLLREQCLKIDRFPGLWRKPPINLGKNVASPHFYGSVAPCIGIVKMLDERPFGLEQFAAHLQG